MNQLKKSLAKPANPPIDPCRQALKEIENAARAAQAVYPYVDGEIECDELERRKATNNHIAALNRLMAWADRLMENEGGCEC